MTEQEITPYEREWQKNVEQLTAAFAALDKPWQMAVGCTLVDADFDEYAGELGFTEEDRGLFFEEAIVDLSHAPELRTRLQLPNDATVDQIEEALRQLFADELVRPDYKQQWLNELIQSDA